MRFIEGLFGRAEICIAPWKKFKFFGGRGSLGTSGGSEKHIWKIFYGGDPEIGPQVPQGGPKGQKFVLENFLLKSY